MDIRVALKQLRKELKLKQVDLAHALEVTTVTVNRWETRKNPPNRTTAQTILQFAKNSGASNVCIAGLERALFPCVEEPEIDDLKYAQLDKINQLLNDSANIVFVCDAETYELLYVNRSASQLSKQPVEKAAGKTCYEFFRHRNTPCKHCHLLQLKEDVFYTREFESLDGDGYYMMRGKRTTWNGRPAHIEYITDITQQHKINKELQRSRALLSTACQDAEIWVFTINVRTGAAHLEPTAQAAFDLPPIVPDFFERALNRGLVSEEYAQEYLDMLEKLRAGKNLVEMVMQVNYPHHKAHWVRLRARAIACDESDGIPAAVCSAQVIDNEVAMATRIKFEHEEILESRDNLMGYVISNLNKNRVLTHKKLMAEAPPVQVGISFDRAIQNAAMRIEPEMGRERFRRAHDREVLLAQFAQGQLAQSIDYQLHQPDGKLLWVHDELKLMRQPQSGDVYLYEYSFSAHTKRIVDGLAAASALSGYRFLGSLSLVNGQLTKLSYANMETGCQPEFQDYTKATEHYCRKWVVAEEQEAFLRSASKERIQAQLEEHGTCCITYHITDRDGRVRTMIGRFTRFDREQMFCLMSVFDVDWINELAEQGKLCNGGMDHDHE